MNALTPILERARVEVARRRAVRPLETVRADGARRHAARVGRGAETVAGASQSFANALAAGGLSVIAEHKRRSPSAGTIRDGIAIEDVVRAFQRAGAAAVSVLTESESFGGTLDDLGRARAATTLPILRKDFIVDVYQVSEAVAAGADAILLIVAALDPGELAVLHAEATEVGLGVLVEVHDAAELAVARELGAAIIGINNRDLTTLEVDVSRTMALAPEVPAGTLIVAESGFRTRAELEALAGAGVDAALIGEALMRSPDIEAACRELIGVGVTALG